MTESASPRPFTAASFDQYLAESKLMASRCLKCGALHLPPRAICPACGGAGMEWAETGGKGRLAGFTVVYVAPTFMVQQGFGRDKPYVTGVVELEEGARISARITGVDPSRPESIQVGTPLQVEFLQAGEGESRKTALAFRAV